MTPRDDFNKLVVDLGLTVTKTTTDGWVYAAQRDDGLHIWRCVCSRQGPGVASAYVKNGHFSDHQHIYGDSYANMLTKMVKRDL